MTLRGQGNSMVEEPDKGSTEPPAASLSEPPPSDISWLEMENIRGGDEQQIGGDEHIGEPRAKA